MSREQLTCPDCKTYVGRVDRRSFLKTAAAVAAGTTPVWAQAKATSTASSPPESLVKVLYDSLDERQKKIVCLPWDYQHKEKGLLRTRVEANWTITDEVINSDFYTKDQRVLIRDIFNGIIEPGWHDRFDRQMEDDAGGFGEDQAIAIFGKPGEGAFEFVLTGRHMTLRCDGNSADHVAFGGPIFYGHAADAFNEKPDHPGNIFWPQAVAANDLFKMLDGKQQKLALVEAGLPTENNVAFRGTGGERDGIPVAELSSDQREQLQKVMQKLVEPYRQTDRDEVVTCLKAQGGLDACSLAFYRDNDIGSDGTWDIWRLEGPAFVWHYRGAPHVHVWVHVADDPSVKLNS